MNLDAVKKAGKAAGKKFIINVHTIRERAAKPYTMKNNPRLEDLVDKSVKLFLDLYKTIYIEKGWDKDGTIQEYPVRAMTLDIAIEMMEPRTEVDAAAALILERMRESVGFLDEFVELTKESLRRKQVQTILLKRGLLQRKA